MNSEANKKAAIAAWHAFRTRDPTKIAAAFTEDAEWLAPAHNATAVALDGPWHIVGKDQIARMFATEVRKLFVADTALARNAGERQRLRQRLLLRSRARK